MANFRLYLRLARPHFLLGGFLVYALGVGIVHYLGYPVNWNVYLLGQLWGTLLQLSVHFLNEYFDAPADEHNSNRTPFTGGSGALGTGKLPRPVALWSGVACLGVVAFFTALIFVVAHPSPSVLLVMALIFLGSLFYSLPPVSFESSGYGELITAIIVANLAPAFAFLLQVGEFHSLLAKVTFPLTTLVLAMLIIIDFPDYYNDVKFEKRTLLVRIGWQAGMTFHNVLILISYVLLAVAVLTGLPLAIALPAFFTLPVGLFQIFQLYRVAAGAKPNWSLSAFTAITTFALTAYLLAFGFWTR